MPAERPTESAIVLLSLAVTATEISSWRRVTAIEGEDDEISLVLEAQWHVSPSVYWKFNSGFGLSEKAEDFAPEIGLMFSF